MRHIYREHLFEHRLNLVRQSWKFYYLSHEGNAAIRILRTPKLDAAFIAESWSAFVEAEAKALHGEVTA
jgi:hypothetical protein